MTEENYRVIKLATTGGFLKSGNTTLMVGIEEEKVHTVIDVIKQISKKRKETLVTSTTLGGSEGWYMQQYPVQINVDEFAKIWYQGEIGIEKNNWAWKYY